MEKIRCRFCRSTRTVGRGFRYNNTSDKHLNLCRKCGKKFTEDDGFLKRRFRKEDIMLAVSLYKKDFSAAEVREKLKRKGVRVSRWTIIKWSRSFAAGQAL